MRSFPFVLLPAIGILVAPLCSSASTVTGSSPTEVSSHVDGSLAGPANAADQPTNNGRRQAEDQAGVGSGLALADLGGLPFMLVGPPQSYALAPHNKIRSLGGGELAASDNGGGGGGSNVSFVSGNGNGGTTSVGSLGSAPQAIPEPFTLLLAGPAMALAIRRRLRRA